jgi:hypothetical protein
VNGANSDNMKKIQLFAAASIDILQSDINAWLAGNKDVDIIESNITSLAKVSVLGSEESTEGQYAFYILYHARSNKEEETLASLAALSLPDNDSGIIESEIN